MTVYIRTYRRFPFLPRGLYRIASQDKPKRVLVLERIDGPTFIKCCSVEAFEMCLRNSWADLSLTTEYLTKKYL